MTHRRRASGTRQMMPGVLLFAAGLLIAMGTPGIWALTHRDPGLQSIDSGIAVQLAQQTAGSGAPGDGAEVPTATQTAPSPEEPASRTPGSAPTEPATTPRSTALPKVWATQSPRASATPTTRSDSPRPAPKPAVVRQPTRLQIPAIGVDAPVEPVGVDGRGEMAIPGQVRQIGWYRYGAAPGDPSGAVVMSGHVDSAQQGLGAFADLSHLTTGDVVTVSDSGGNQRKYRVVGKEAFDKKTVPLADLFSRKGSARLTLITCGGGFDSVARSYLDNIVITAVPA